MAIKKNILKLAYFIIFIMIVKYIINNNLISNFVGKFKIEQITTKGLMIEDNEREILNKKTGFEMKILNRIKMHRKLSNKTNKLVRLNGQRILKELPNIKIFDLNRPLLPKSVYEKIYCRKSEPFIVSTTLCVHDTRDDYHISRTIIDDGFWEGPILRDFVKQIDKNPGLLVIDIGANIGSYSLFAAKLGSRVVSVEPFHENVIRIHKAAVIENLQNKIILIENAISDERNKTKLLKSYQNNIGANSLLPNKDITFNKNPDNKYLVETILFDDLIRYLPKPNSFDKKQQAIIKIDIEGYEPFAFKHANHFFNKLEIITIYMEWGHMKNHTELKPHIEGMIDFLMSKNLFPFWNDKILEKSFWQNWPWDIIWKKKNNMSQK